ncbi:hypothetical protein HQN86_24445 [Pedobacter panaciterrae]|uniref:hypothetical protein n=1 Tax=Pedobacter panaciterrae TaxID=363849 RepID=UPI00155D9EE6|nr:hypothetical protein [Pedobacter panaciterrae]NQX56790.1 hypothetical protein [Pedobacter panaciterrae]
MSIRTVDEISGRYEIEKGIKESDLIALVENPNTNVIQFSKPLAEKDIENLELLVFSKRKDITLRVYGHYIEGCDLRFLVNMPSLAKVTADCLYQATGIEAVTELKNLTSLSVGIFNLESFDFLNDIPPSVRELILQQSKSKKPRIDSIARFEDLEYLYLEGQQKGIEAISHLKKLERIVLRSISVPNLEVLSDLKELWSVDIKLGGIKNFNALKNLPNLKYLELWQIRGLADLSFISELNGLQNLFVQALPQVERVPELKNLTALRRIYLENLKGLKDLFSLRSAPALEEFTYVLAQNQEPENLIPVLENPNVKRVCCRMGSSKKDDKFDELVSLYGKQEYEFREFIYD